MYWKIEYVTAFNPGHMETTGTEMSSGALLYYHKMVQEERSQLADIGLTPVVTMRVYTPIREMESVKWTDPEFWDDGLPF